MVSSKRDEGCNQENDKRNESSKWGKMRRKRDSMIEEIKKDRDWNTESNEDSESRTFLCYMFIFSSYLSLFHCQFHAAVYVMIPASFIFTYEQEVIHSLICFLQTTVVSKDCRYRYFAFEFISLSFSPYISLMSCNHRKSEWTFFVSLAKSNQYSNEDEFINL